MHDSKPQPILGEDSILTHMTVARILIESPQTHQDCMEGGHGKCVHHTQLSAQFDIRLWDESMAQPGIDKPRGEESEYGENHKHWTMARSSGHRRMS